MSKVDAVKFIMRCQNWSEIAIPIARHEKPKRVFLRNGLRFEAPAIHWWDLEDIFFNQAYNPPHLSIGKNDLVVDIGANIGVFTIYAASKTANAVYAFEPSRSCFEVLKQNVQANRLENVKFFNYAVADKSGVQAFIDSEDSTARKLECIKPDSDGNRTEVRVTTLQEIMDTNNIEQIDFLKMDCEGSEGLILGSVPVDYLKKVKKLAMEFHDGISKIKHDGMRKILEEAGFQTGIRWNGRSLRGHLYGWRS